MVDCCRKWDSPIHIILSTKLAEASRYSSASLQGSILKQGIPKGTHRSFNISTLS
jgi:hypothetical protein